MYSKWKRVDIRFQTSWIDSARRNERTEFSAGKAGQLLEKYVDVDAMIGIAESALWEKEETVTEEVKPEEKENLEEKAYSGKVTIFLRQFSVEKRIIWQRELRYKYNTAPHRSSERRSILFLLPWQPKNAGTLWSRAGIFSPLHDEKLPENIHGILLGGGYPELYASQLEENESMRKSIKEALEQQLPSLAECGGFMYLHDTLTDREGTTYQMAGVIPAECQYTGKLVRFGYVEVQLPQGLTEKGTAEMPEPEK